MLLSLVVAAEEQMLSKASVTALKALLVAYAKDGEKPRVGGAKKELIARVATAVRDAGTGGFARPPVFGDGDTADDALAYGGGGEKEGLPEEGPSSEVNAISS
jgi:hypothetical protein